MWLQNILLNITLITNLYHFFITRHGRSQGLLDKQCYNLLIWSLSHCFPPHTSRHRHSQRVRDSPVSYKIDFLHLLTTLKFLEDIKIASLVQKLLQFCFVGGYNLLVELHRKGSW